MKTQFVAVFNTPLIMVSWWLVSMSFWVATGCNPQSSVEPQNKEVHDKRHPSLAELDMFVFLESLAWEGQQASKLICEIKGEKPRRHWIS